MKNNRLKELEKQAYDIDVSGLPDNIDVGEVVTNLIAGAPTLAKLVPQTGIKAGSTEQLNILDTDVTWSAGQCVTTETGDNTTIVDRNLTTAQVTDRELLCLDQVSAKLPMYMAAGADNQDLDFANLWTNYKIQKNSYQLEKLVWQGDTAGAGNLSMTDGYLKIASGETGSLAYDATYGAGDLTGIASFSADPIAVMELIAANRTDEMYEMSMVKVWMNLANYNAFGKAVRDTYGLDATGNYTNSGEESDDQVMRLPGTNVFACGTHGLNGVDSLFVSYDENLRYGTDLENDRETASVFFSEYHRQLVSDIIFSVGFQYQDPSQVMLITA